MRDPEKLVRISRSLAKSTPCQDCNEEQTVELGALQASGWLLHSRGLSAPEYFTTLIDGIREERGGFVSERTIVLSAAGFNGLLAVADIFAPDVQEEL